MAESRETILARLRVTGEREFARDMHSGARAVDEVGDQAQQTSRDLDRMGEKALGAAARMATLGVAARTNTRINLGPFSTSIRGAGLAVGAFALTVQSASGPLLGLIESLGTAAIGAGAAGGVGLLAFGQAAGTASLAMQGLQKALQGDADAFFKLNPAQQTFVMQLEQMRPLLDRLRASAAGGLLPGLGQGLQSASRNFGVVDQLTRGTSGALGGLAAQAGSLVGSRGFGRDLATVGSTNIRIIENMGAAGLHLADALRHVAVEAAPLAEWISRMALRGAKLTDEWVRNKRETGDLARFFRQARVDLTLLASIGGHTGAGILNLFGARDVDGTKTLQNIDEMTARFERWSRTLNRQGGLGKALEREIPQLAASAADLFVRTAANAAPRAASIFWRTFEDASPLGKVLIAGFAGNKLLGGLRGATPLNPLFVKDVAGGVGGRGGRTGGGARSAAKTAARVAGAAGAVVLADEAAHAAQHKIAPGLDRATRRAERETGVSFMSPGGIAHTIDTGIDAVGHALGSLGHLLGGVDTASAATRRNPVRMQLPDIHVTSPVLLDSKVLYRAHSRVTWEEATRKGISPAVGGESISGTGKRGF